MNVGGVKASTIREQPNHAGDGDDLLYVLASFQKLLCPVGIEARCEAAQERCR